ncbi:DUF1516 family protein [Sporolactobacillus putidus]|uniref:DUF1516 family protein n=1 Tax=Sporolactobacillus putidus TaxID=492735 RepID=A0A917S195_9BACL|nr:DUF1516 family protein [Sporolactobacillus putidus]GGL49762.1 hypothetical protein GCM10007968_12380 [Sporolactobacillus putidus]
MFNILLHTHSGMWGIMVLLFILSFAFYRQRGWNMGLRLAYLVMLVTGVWMLALKGFPWLFILKGILALILIGMMEMTLGRRRRKEPTFFMWILIIVILAVILLIGYEVL